MIDVDKIKLEEIKRIEDPKYFLCISPSFSKEEKEMYFKTTLMTNYLNQFYLLDIKKIEVMTVWTICLV